MPRGLGSPNYNNEVLIQIVDTLKPTGAAGWENVAVLCQSRSKEIKLREYEDVKRQWIEKLCNKMKKPTGRSGGSDNDRIFSVSEFI
jgi:hypothetical protein